VPAPGAYGPSSVDWVRDEVEHLEASSGVARDGRPLVVLTTVGVLTGLRRKTPLMRVEHRGTYAVVASMAGADHHPAWYANVLARPQVELRDGAVVLPLVAREVDGPERARWWSRACTVFPSYATYQSRTRRRIPLLLLEAPVVAG
jgi:deazaflavin-dependent oxidoreductase (nitroreductase family)